ncbi:MAG: hypothetical protein LBE78_13060 [Burkholderiaceae bacterium]|jgi:hypothetical protein|nr:hypothetical protein [Burkholderiaceae bacterium]
MDATTYLLIGVMVGSLAVGAWLDNQPTDTDALRAGAASLCDAQAEALRQRRRERAEAAMRGM